MRKLLWFSLGFAASCAVGAYFLLSGIFAIIGVAFLVISVICLLLRLNNGWKKFALVLLGCGMGLLWLQIYNGCYLAAPKSLDGETVSVQFRATDFSFDTGYGTGVDGKITLGNQSYKARIYLDSDQQVSPGTVIHGEFRFRFTTLGGQREPTYHRSQGIFLMAYQTGDTTVVPAATRSWRYIPAYLRRGIVDYLDSMFSYASAPFAKALLIGDTTDLDYATQTHLMLSGIRHVAAVSGLHVSILFSMVYLIAGKRRFLTAILGIPCLLLFAAVAGFTPSIMRACMMQLLMILAMVFNREYDPPTALAFAVVTMLSINPHCASAVGFQLSVASVAGIFLFASRIYNRIMGFGPLSKIPPKTYKGRFVRAVAGSVSVSVSAVVLTAPLTAIYFDCVSLIGILTNLLCLWAVTILFCGLIAVCVIGLVWLPAAKIICWVLEWLIGYILGVSTLLSKFPLAAIYTDSTYIVLWLVFCYILLGAYFIMKNKRPVTLLCCMTVTLCVALLASWFEPLLDNYRVTALDVGQGQCIILQNGRKTFMVDCGGDRAEDAADQAAAYLHSRGIYHIDGLIITHYDEDHVGGIPYFLQRIPADLLVLPGQEDHDLKTAIEAVHKSETVIVNEDISLDWNTGNINLYPGEISNTSNESSLCVLFKTEKCDILITGDRSQAGEAKLLQTHSLPDIEVLVAGHHGAKDATGELLLTVTKPEIVLISVSENNNFGHPSDETLQRLIRYGCKIYRTDLEGNIIIRG